MTDLLIAPTNVAAEWSCLGHMLHDSALIAEVIGVPLEPGDFSQPDTRLIFQRATERHYQGQPVDPLIIGELCRDELAQFWNADPGHVGELLERRSREGQVKGNLLDHAGIVKKLSTKRQIQDACYHALTAINDGSLGPEEVGDRLSSEVLQATAGNVRRSELLSWMDVGRAYVNQLQVVMAAKQEGREIGVYTGLSFIDNYTTGIGPGELCFVAGDPGTGKTALAWASALGFSQRQAMRPPPGGKRRVATLIVSAEMNLYGSSQRVVQNICGIDGVRLREGAITKDEYQHLLREWKNREHLPLYWNFASNFRLSQLRALIAEGIRKYNVGFVVLDHFRMVDPDRRIDNSIERDEERVRFLKQNIARDLDVALMVLAHTIKVGRGQSGESPRPRMSDMRGSGMISAFADQIALLWSPYKYMSEEARVEMFASPGDMEVVWDKNRFGIPSTAQYAFTAETMKVQPR